QHASRDAAQPWIILVARLRQRRSRRLAQNGTAPAYEILVVGLVRELVEECGIVVLSEEAKENPPGMDQRRRVFVPTVFQKAANGGDSPNAFELIRSWRRHGQH